jgi:hypothetical protein
MSIPNIPNTHLYQFGDNENHQGTAYLTVDLVRETEEYGRNLTVVAKAHHPQMESLITLKGQETPVFSLAACGFHQLATTKEIPAEVAEQYDVPQWGFRNSAVVNICESVLAGIPADRKPILTVGAMDCLQQFLILYAQAVWRIDSPLVLMMGATCVQEVKYAGVSWFTFPVAFIMSVEQEEWMKLYELKKAELDWATRVLDMATLRAKIGASLAISKSKTKH